MTIKDILGPDRTVTDKAEIIAILEALQEASGDDMSQSIDLVKNGEATLEIDGNKIKIEGTYVKIERSDDKNNGLSSLFGRMFGKRENAKPGNKNREPVVKMLDELVRELGEIIEKKKKEGQPCATSIAVILPFVGAELLKFAGGMSSSKDAAEAATSLAKILSDEAKNNEVRYANVEMRSIPYGLRLDMLRVQMEKFAEKPESETARALAAELGRAIPILFRVVLDVADNLKEQEKRHKVRQEDLAKI